MSQFVQDSQGGLDPTMQNQWGVNANTQPVFPTTANQPGPQQGFNPQQWLQQSMSQQQSQVGQPSQGDPTGIRSAGRDAALQQGLGAIGMGSGTAGTAGTDAIGSLLGSVGCCFIFLEAYNGRLPWFVRVARDIAYEQDPVVGEGYKRMAKWLVPLMIRYRIVADLVNECMIKPLTEQAGYQLSVEGCQSRLGYKKFWWFVWTHV